MTRPTKALWFAPLAILAGCATASGGSFAIRGETLSDSWSSLGVYLAAKHVFLDPAAGTLYADVVDRTYALASDGASFDAQGTFEASKICPGGHLHERWILHGGDALEGTLDSSWPVPPDCQTMCTIRFAIHGARLKAEPRSEAAGGESRRATP